MSSYYTVPSASKTVASVQSSVLAVGVALLFVFVINFVFQILITFVIDREEKDRNRIKQKLLETSRVLYLYFIASFFSIYPPFYYGPHCAILAWITLVIVILMHMFTVVEKSCKERSLWSYMYFAYHLAIAIWIILALIIGYIWANQQDAALDQL